MTDAMQKKVVGVPHLSDMRYAVIPAHSTSQGDARTGYA